MSGRRIAVGLPEVLGAALAVVVVVGVSLEVGFAVTNPGELASYRLVSYLYLVPPTIALTVVSAAVLGRHPGHPVGWLLGFLAAVGGVSLLANGYIIWELPARAWIAWLDGLVSAPAFGVLALALLLFPTGRPPSPRWQWLLWSCRLQVLVTIALASVAARPVPVYPNEIPVPDPFAIGGQALSDATALIAGLGIPLLLASAVSLVVRWRSAAGEQRLQVKWIGAACVIFAVTSALGPALLLLGFDHESGAAVEFLVGDAIWNLALTLVPVAMGFGIVRYRLYDIDRLISRTIVYGVLAFFLGAAYVAVVVTLGGELTSRVSSTGVGLVATAAVAVAFHPLRRGLSARVDRWVYGPRSAPHELCVGLAKDLGRAVDPAQVLDRIAEVAHRAAAAESIEVSVRLPGGRVEMASRGVEQEGAVDLVVPVCDGDEVIGEIAVVGGADRRGDRVVLDRIAGLATPALRNLRLLAELDDLHRVIQDQNHRVAASRSRMIAAAADERRNFERSVETHVVPHLAVLREAVPELRALVRQDPETAATRCDELVDRATRVVEEIRGLSRGVLPPVLADHGLAAALRADLRRLNLEVEMDVSTSFGRFDTNIEVATYLCCRAALDDARASGSTRASLSLATSHGMVHFAVTHDGATPAGEPAGTERDLIETLGGTLRAVRDADRTVVSGDIPLDVAQPTSLRKVSTA